MIDIIVILLLVIGVSVYVDLYAHRNVTEISVKDATVWSVFWIMTAIAFYVYLIFRLDVKNANLYLAGYALEKSLSIDNLIVFMAIFSSFNIVGKLQHRILYWGIIGALVFRAIFVVLGVKLLNAAPFVGLIFALFIGWSGYKMLMTKDDGDEEQEDYSQHWSIKLIGRFMPVFPRLIKNHFVVNEKEIKENGFSLEGLKKSAWYFTPAFLCLIAIETSDIAFAFDSVPAVIAITEEPVLVYSCMIFAILGLRSLYFILAALTKILVHLEKAVIALLFFIAFKMTIESWNKMVEFYKMSDSVKINFHISATVSLFIVLFVLLVGVVSSFIFPKKDEVEISEK